MKPILLALLLSSCATVQNPNGISAAEVLRAFIALKVNHAGYDWRGQLNHDMDSYAHINQEQRQIYYNNVDRYSIDNTAKTLQDMRKLSAPVPTVEIIAPVIQNAIKPNWMSIPY